MVQKSIKYKLISLYYELLIATGTVLSEYSRIRNRDAEAICDLAMYNYIEVNIFKYTLKYQGAKKVSFTACHSGNLYLACTGPKVISTSPKNVLMHRIDYTVLLSFEFLKNFTCPLGKLRSKFTSPIAKSTSHWLSDTTFFPCQV